MTTAKCKEVTKGQSKTRLGTTARSAKGAAKSATHRAGKLRTRLILTQAEFARLLPVSVRPLATIEGGTYPKEPVARRLIEL
jgi:DNA-binding transcriptional regulator YiaG